MRRSPATLGSARDAKSPVSEDMILGLLWARKASREKGFGEGLLMKQKSHCGLGHHGDPLPLWYDDVVMMMIQLITHKQ